MKGFWSLATYTRHARKRLAERDLDQTFVNEVADKTKGLLTNRPLKLSHRGITLVAQKTTGGEVKIITAWK